MRFSLFLAIAVSSPLAAQYPSDAEVAALFDAWDQTDRPGAVIGVVHDGTLVHAQAFGNRDATNEAPNTIDTRFYVASVTKQFTAACVLLLEQRGELSLDDGLRQHMPELPEYGSEITLRHLLHHRSGLRDFYELAWLAGWPIFDLNDRDAVLELVCRQRGTNFPPGRDFMYCNTGYLLLALVVERVSGKSFAEFAVVNILRPLGMKHSVFKQEASLVVPNAASGHDQKDGVDEPRQSRFALVGPGGLYSTVPDLAKWANNFTTGKVGGQQLIERMLAVPRLDPDQTWQPSMTGYAGGLMPRTHRGVDYIGHGGQFGGFRAELLRFPGQDYSFIVLANTTDLNPNKQALRLADLFMPEVFAAAETAAAPRNATASERPANGRYMFRERVTGAIVGLAVSGGRAQLESLLYTMRLRPTSATTFVAIGTRQPVQAQRFDDRLELSIGTSQPRLFDSMPTDRPSSEDLAAVAGSYWSDELDTELRLEIKRGRLCIATELARPVEPFATVSSEVFVSRSRLLVEVNRDADGTVTGIALSTQRARRLLFERR